MGEWRKYKLSEVIDEFIDYRGKTPKKIHAGIPLVTAKIVKGGRILEPNEFISEAEYHTWMRRGYPQENDVVLTTEAPLGEVALLKNSDVALAQRIITLRGNPELLSNIFLKYYLQSAIGQYELHSRSSGTTVLGIKSSVLKKVPISLPRLPEQKAIAEVLSSLDDKIDLLHRQNRTLEALAETLFRQWFVEEASEDYRGGVLNEIVIFNPELPLKKGTSAPYLEMSSVSKSSCNPTKWYLRGFNSGMRFQNNDTLLARITPCLENGKVCFVTFLKANQIGWGSTEYIVMRMKEGYHPFISYIFAKEPNFREFAISCMSGSSGRQRVQAKNLKEYGIKIPPHLVLQKINGMLEIIVPKIINNFNQIHTLEKLRDTLLPKLMSGEVSIQRSEKLVEVGT